MAMGVTEKWSHDEGTGERSVTLVLREHKTKMQLRAWKCNKWACTEAFRRMGHCFSVCNNVLYGIYTRLHGLL